MSEVQSIPLYLQMAQQIEEQIERGGLQPGARLPSYGQMRKQHGANPVTLERAYGVLEKRGLIRREAKRGVFVAEVSQGRVGVARPVLKVFTSSVLGRNEYYASLLSGIQAEAQRRNAEIVLCNEDSLRDGNRADGIVLLAPLYGQRESLPKDLPCIAIMHQDIKGISSITVDDGAGIAASIEYLVGLGHQRIGYLTLEKVLSQWMLAPRRLEAYRTALKAAGIEPDSRWERALRDSNREPYQDFVDLGRHKMDLWLRDNWAELGLTALLAQNDETAIGAMQALEDACIRVPEQVSVVGFDGINAGTCVRPRLTTVGVPLEEIGAAAVAKIVEQIRRDGGRDQVRSTMEMPPHFIARASTTWAPGAGGAMA